MASAASRGKRRSSWPIARAERLGGDLGRHRAAALPPRLVANFYRVRFGRAVLDPAETDAIARMLVEVNEGLEAGRGERGTRG